MARTFGELRTGNIIFVSFFGDLEIGTIDSISYLKDSMDLRIIFIHNNDQPNSSVHISIEKDDYDKTSYYNHKAHINIISDPDMYLEMKWKKTIDTISNSMPDLAYRYYDDVSKLENKYERYKELR